MRVYAFEAGGNGHYDVQAGLENPGPNAHAISTALGYNQLLNTNSVELLSEHGENFVKALTAKAATLSGPRKAALKRKIDILRRMTAVSKSVPDEWSEHEKLANTPQGLGIHALNLDIDVGPLLQTHKLLNSVDFARRKKFTAPLTAAELEMMNLHRRWQRIRYGHDVIELSQPGTDGKFFSAKRLRSQSRGDHQ